MEYLTVNILFRHAASSCTITGRRWSRLAIILMSKEVFVRLAQHICRNPFAE